MTFAHVLYIPVVLLVGLAFGYVLGAKAVRRELEQGRRQARR